MADTPIKNIYQRIHAAMDEVTYIQKEKKAGMQYSTVSHDSVTALVRPALHKQGVVYHLDFMEVTQDGNRTEVKMNVKFVNIDDPTDYIDVPSFGYGIDNQDKGPGKAMSYAVKYALLKTLGLETGDDPDNDQDVVHKPAEPKPIPFNRDMDQPPFPVASRDPSTPTDGITRPQQNLLYALSHKLYGSKEIFEEREGVDISEMTKGEASEWISQLKERE